MHICWAAVTMSAAFILVFRGRRQGALVDYLRHLAHFFRCWCSLRPHLVVGHADAPYMLRWWLIPRNPLCNVYLHKFLRDDDDRALHDHPWKSWSLLLRGELFEVFIPDPEYATAPKSRWGRVEHSRTIRAGTWIYRSATFTHRLALPGGPAWTLFITGPWSRGWGFHCRDRWVPWREFV